MRRAVELRHRNDVAAEIRHVQQCIVQRGLASADAHGFDAPFQCRDPPIQYLDGWIADPAIAETFGLEIEQGGAVLGGIECVCNGLVDWNRDRVSCGVGLVTAVDRDGLASHCPSCMRTSCASIV